MNYSIDELQDLADRYAAEKNFKLPILQRTRFVLWADWLQQQKLQQTDVVGSGDGFPDEDDEDYYQPEPECQICGKVDGHHRGCPEDDSPFALLERRGFD